MTTPESRCPFGQGFDFTDPDVLLRGKAAPMPK